MAGTIRNATVAISLAALLSGGARGAELTDVRLQITSGTLTLQRVAAAEATLLEGGDQVHTKNLDMDVRLSSGETARAKAEEGFFFIGNSAGNQPQADETITEDFIRRYASEFATYGATGDMYMIGREEPVKAEVGTEGTIETNELVWSERLQKYLVPGSFRQWATMRDGARVETRGDSAVVDSDFREWTYYGVDTGSSEIIFNGQAANKGEDN